MRRTLSGVAALTLAVAGLTVGAQASSAATPAGTDATMPVTTGSIAWAKCANPGLTAAGAQCATVQVPLDHANPGGAKVSIAVSRVRHTVPDSKYQGVMLVNPGGPGGSGLTLSVLGRYVPHGAGAAYDWIGFDPRGVGDSKPALTCIPDYFHGDRPDYVPTSGEVEQTWLARSARYAKACGANGGALLDHMKTTDVAADLDDLRVALGQQKINYYGFSYGTYLGQVYATEYPLRIRRAVFDSNVDPRNVFYRSNLNQDVAFERNFGLFLSWVAKNDATYHLGTTARAVENLYYAKLDELRRTPKAGIGPDEWTDAFLSVGYAQFLWPSYAEGFSTYVRTGDIAPIVAQYGGGGSENGFAVYNAVQCTDAPWPKDFATWRTDNWNTYEKARFETWSNAWFNAPCLTWPAKAHAPVKVDGTEVRPILVLGETLDAATPFPGNVEVRKRFPGARLVATVGGATHADSLNGLACVDDKIAAYLATGALPPRKAGNVSDATCAAAPDPAPTAAAALKAAPGQVPVRQELTPLR